jgi:glycosyltransferase involved in cell wall biosynthesis
MFTLHFHGMFIPLQGIEYILGAAKILINEPMKFVIVGSGQEYKKAVQIVVEQQLTNVALLGKMPFEKLPEMIAASDMCLGIFGHTEKAARVVPNKVFEYIAMNKPVITADTKAVREFFTDGVDMTMCASADAASLAEAIRKVQKDAASCARIAQKAYERSCAEFAPAPIVKNLLKSPLLS